MSYIWIINFKEYKYEENSINVNSFISGISTILLGLFILPPSNKFITEKLHLKLSKLHKVIIIIVLIIIASQTRYESPFDECLTSCMCGADFLDETQLSNCESICTNIENTSGSEGLLNQADIWYCSKCGDCTN